MGLLLRAAPLGLLLLLSVGWLLPQPSGLTLAARASDIALRVEATLDAMPESPVVVVGFDPDIGTYPEIRPAVRALLADLLEREARLVLVNVTPEGRALLLAEIGRLRASSERAVMVDLGFVAGAEAALVALSRTAPAPDAPVALRAQLAADGIAAADLIVVVGGNEIGPRTWVEQVLPRVDQLPLVAISPTVLLPELLPYVESGQVDALIGTPGDGAAYRESVASTPGAAADDRLVDRLALLLGLLVGIAVLGQALGERILPGLRIGGRGERA